MNKKITNSEEEMEWLAKAEQAERDAHVLNILIAEKYGLDYDDVEFEAKYEIKAKDKKTGKILYHVKDLYAMSEMLSYCVRQLELQRSMKDEYRPFRPVNKKFYHKIIERDGKNYAICDTGEEIEIYFWEHPNFPGLGDWFAVNPEIHLIFETDKILKK